MGCSTAASSFSTGSDVNRVRRYALRETWSGQVQRTFQTYSACCLCQCSPCSPCCCACSLRRLLWGEGLLLGDMGELLLQVGHHGAQHLAQRRGQNLLGKACDVSLQVRCRTVSLSALLRVACL